MKYIIIISIVLCSCKSSTYTQLPTLAQKQELYQTSTDHKLLKQKRFANAVFWYSTIFIMSYVYVSTARK